MPVLDRIEPEFVGRSVRDPSLDTATGQPAGEPLRMMVPAVALGPRGPSELGAENDQRPLEHTTPLEILEESSDRLVDLGSLAVIAFLDFVVRVPLPGTSGPVVQLNETHALFDQPASGQALGTEFSRVFLVEAVQALRGLGLCLEVHDIRDGRLHAGRQFVRPDPRPQLRIVGILDPDGPIQLSDQIQFGLLLFGRHTLPEGAHERQRIGRIGGEFHAGVVRPEIAGPVGKLAPAAATDRMPHHDKLGQLLIPRPQAVGDPRPDGRPSPLADMVPGVPGQLHAVVGMHRPQRPHHRQVIGTFPDVREPVTDLQAAIAVGVVAGLQTHQVLAWRNHAALSRQVLLSAFLVQKRGERGLLERLAVVLVERRLDVEALHVTDATGQEDPDHRIGLGRKMRVGFDPCRPSLRLGRRVIMQHRPQGQPGEPHPGIGQEGASRQSRRIGRGTLIVSHGLFPHPERVIT